MRGKCRNLRAENIIEMCGGRRAAAPAFLSRARQLFAVFATEVTISLTERFTAGGSFFVCGEEVRLFGGEPNERFILGEKLRERHAQRITEGFEVAKGGDRPAGKGVCERGLAQLGKFRKAVYAHVPLQAQFVQFCYNVHMHVPSSADKEEAQACCVGKLGTGQTVFPIRIVLVCRDGTLYEPLSF